MSRILEQLLQTLDVFGSGHSGEDQLGLAYPLNAGLFFPDLAGCYVLLRRSLYASGDVSDWRVAGAAGLGSTTIKNWLGVDHDVSQGYQYMAAKVHGNGFASPFTEAVRVDFDSGGDIIAPALPAWPTNALAVPSLAGIFLVSWSYDPWGEGAPPTDFQVFEGATAAAVDYGTALGTIVAEPSRVGYEFETGAYTDGTVHVFAVRARNSGGVAELNTYTAVPSTAEDGTPGAATIQIARSEDEGR